MTSLVDTRIEIASAAKDAGLIVDEADIDPTFTQGGNGHQSQYIALKADCGVDADGYRLAASFTVRVSDHYQIKSCGAKADLCTFSDGKEAILSALAKIGADKLAFVKYIEETSGSLRDFAAIAKAEGK